MRTSYILLIYFLLMPLLAFSQAGQVDTTFNPGDVEKGSGLGAYNGYVNHIVKQNDGKYIISGIIEKYNNNNVFNILRILPNGYIDTTFNTPNLKIGDNGSVNSNYMGPTLQQSDSELIVSIGRPNLNSNLQGGTPYIGKQIYRLKMDGSIDSSFRVISDSSGIVRTMAQQSDGKIIIGGNFSRFSGRKILNLARIFPNGEVDTTFRIGSGVFNDVNWSYYNTNNVVNDVQIDENQYIYIAGYFNRVDQLYVKSVARLLPTGEPDTTFKPKINAGYFNSILLDDDKIYVGGIKGYDTINQFNGLVRLNFDGSIDSSFHCSGISWNGGMFTKPMVDKVLKDIDGRIVVSGNFSDFNGLIRHSVTRLNVDGSNDSIFIDPMINSDVKGLCLLDSGIVIGGCFTDVQNKAVNHFAKLDNSGALDVKFNKQTGANNLITKIEINSDDKIFACGNFTGYNTSFNGGKVIKLNKNGELDTLFRADSVLLNCNLVHRLNDSLVFVSSNYVYKVNESGGIDSSFTSNTAFVSLRNIKLFKNHLFISHSSGYKTIRKFYLSGTIDSTYNSSTLIIPRDFEFIGDKILVGGSGQNSLELLDSIGDIDTNFYWRNKFNGQINKIIRLPNQKILVAGSFSLVDNLNIRSIVRFNPDFTIDTTFYCGAGANNVIYDVKIDNTEKLYIAGDFTEFDGYSKNRLVRLNHDGSVDNSFNIGTGADAYIRSIAFQSDGKLIIAGDFTSFNGVPRNRIARILTEESNSINDLTKSNNKLVLYPNPTTGEFSLLLNNEQLSQINEINIYNSTGQNVKKLNKETTQNISELPAGVYTLQIKTNKGEVFNTKLVKW